MQIDPSQQTKVDNYKLLTNLVVPRPIAWVSAPTGMSLDNIQVFAISKLGWIRQEQQKLQQQEREPQREYLDSESHYVWGKRYLLEIVLADTAPSVELKHRRMVLHARSGTDETKKQLILEAWYRKQLRDAVPALIAKWEPLMSVKVSRLFLQRMTTKWGSCTPASQSIRLNTDIAKKPRECLEYIVVYEMVHLIEPTHNARFVSWMYRFMPRWSFYRDLLNRLPVRHETWQY